MIAALWANSNWDDDKGTRTRVIEEIEESYAEAIDRVLDRNWSSQKEQDDVDFENNPFFDKMRKGLPKLEAVENEQSKGTVAEVIDMTNMDQS